MNFEITHWGTPGDGADLDDPYPRKVLEPGEGVAAMLTYASWILAQLPDRVVQRRRGNPLKTLVDARDLVVEVHCAPAVILIRNGDRALMKIPGPPLTSNAAAG
jgi:hypothetical protein